MISCNNIDQSSSGFAIVEFALAVPLFVMVLCLVLELGCYLMTTASLSSFTYAAAREYSQNTAITNSQLIETARGSAPNLNIDHLTVSVNALAKEKIEYTHHFPDETERSSYLTEQTASIETTYEYSPLTFVGALMTNNLGLVEINSYATSNALSMSNKELSQW